MSHRHNLDRVTTLDVKQLYIGGVLLAATAGQLNDLAGAGSTAQVTPGTVTAGEPVVVDSNKDVTGFRNVTATGTVSGGTLTTTSGTIDATTGATDIKIVDNNATSLRIREATNDYMIFVTTDGAESVTFKKEFIPVFSAASADGAITQKQGVVYITKAGIAVLTIADPVATTDDGKTLTVISTTANAHTLSNGAGSGFNAGGAATDVGTFGGAKGDNIMITAYQGKWYVVAKTNVTLG